MIGRARAQEGIRPEGEVQMRKGRQDRASCS